VRTTPSIASLALILGLLPGAALAQGGYDSLSDSDLDARLRFIEERLEGGERHAKWWQHGWTGVYVAGIAVGTGQAAATDSGKNRANYITTAVKGVIGTTRLLLSPHPGRNGADEIAAVNFGNTREAKIQRLQRGEQILEAVAKRARQRTNWIPHAANVGLNLVGAGFILGFGHSMDAVESFAVGVAVGEAHLWSAPWRGVQDLEDYQTRFGGKTSSRFEWNVVPTVGGAALNVTW
jgi:hypothetical protein